MNTNILSTMTEQSKNMMAVAQELNNLAVAEVEKVTALQLASLQNYADLGVNQLKGAAAVNDLESLRAYLSTQPELLKSVGEKMVADAQALTKIGVEFGVEAQKVLQGGLVAVAPKAAPKVVETPKAA